MATRTMALQQQLVSLEEKVERLDNLEKECVKLKVKNEALQEEGGFAFQQSINEGLQEK
eukprot:Pgem_evm1s8320